MIALKLSADGKYQLVSGYHRIAVMQDTANRTGQTLIVEATDIQANTLVHIRIKPNGQLTIERA